MTTILAFVFVLGVLVFVHELGHFLAARRIGVRVLTFSLGFGPTHRQVHARRHRVLHQRDPARRLREDGRREPRRPADRAPDEFLSKTKWQRFQVLIMGPVMNLVLAVVRDGRRAHAGRGRAGVPRRAAGRRRHRAGVAGRAGRLRGRATAILTVDGTRRSTTWEKFDIAVGTRPNREVIVTVQRDRRAPRRSRSRRSRRASSRSATSACSRTSIRASGRSRPATRPTRPASRPATWSSRSTASACSFARQLSDAIGKNAEQADRAARSSATARTCTVPVTPRRDGTVGRIGISIGNEMRARQAGAARGREDERRAERGRCRGLIFQTLWGLFSGETSPKQLMGPVGDRAAVRRVRPGWAGSRSSA